MVVGGASGMARATAEMLVREGARVAILDLPTAKGEEAAAAIGGSTRFYPCDVTDFAGTEAAIARAADELGALHFGVNTGELLGRIVREGETGSAAQLEECRDPAEGLSDGVAS